MTNYILSIDPGISTGIALIGYEPDSAPELVGAWQFTGGVSGLLTWERNHHRPAYYDSEWGEDYAAAINPFEGGYARLLLEDEGRWDYLAEDDDGEEEWVTTRPKEVTVVAEKFNARNTKGFSYTTDTLEPLRGEGALIALRLMPDYTPKEKRWRAPALQYLVGGKDLADKKKRQHAFLKDIGFYRTNKDFPDSPAKDGADDFRSAVAHGLNYLAREVKHKPTFDLMTEWSNS